MIQEKNLCNIVIFITLALASLATADANNLIVNGNFEFGNLEGYYYAGALIDSDNGPTETGFYCISADDGNDFATYPYCIRDGKTYVASWDYKTAADETGTVAKGHLRFYDMDENIIGVVDVNITNTGGSWVAQTPVSMAAPAGTKALDVAFDNIATSYGPIKVDNIVVYEQNPGPMSYLDVNDSMLVNAGFEETMISMFYLPWTGWYHPPESSFRPYLDVIDTDSVGGDKCVQMYRPSVSGPNEVNLPSWSYYPAKSGESFAVSFSYKTLAGTTGSARASFRYWRSDGELLAERIWSLAPTTNNEWVTMKSCCLSAPEQTAYVDIWFVMNEEWGNMVGTMRIDNVTVIKTNTKGDLNCDCEINFYDFALLAQKWSTTIRN